ncbi:MAG: NAD-dependent epimerase/dehydratase family protein [candidate division WOR-3 bacterium]|nr:NAD-dependent epimerase/dehydratase family protein [candidate division WOR-3 bacterium]
MERILVTGAVGQIGSELVEALRKKYGNENVVAAGHKTKPTEEMRTSGPFEFIDVTSRESIERVIKKYNIGTIYHLAAILSAIGEEKPQLTFRVNIIGLYNILEIGLKYKLERIMVPSSIAVFGPQTPRENTPNETILRPTTMYGVSKVAGELLGDYYYRRFGLDFRGVRYPGIISSKTLPGGGTTDYAVEIFYEAIKKKKYNCYLRKDSTLPMMYMPDAIRGIIELAEADIKNLKHHSDYNLAAMSFSPEELTKEIQRIIPEFKCEYKPDSRQEIADSWPKSIDDSAAREEWGWEPEYNLRSMTKDMVQKLREKIFKGS